MDVQDPRRAFFLLFEDPQNLFSALAPFSFFILLPNREKKSYGSFFFLRKLPPQFFFFRK